MSYGFTDGKLKCTSGCQVSTEDCIKEEKTCPSIFKPICGSDGLSYTNSCYAEAVGVGIACDGKCPCKKITKEDVINYINTYCSEPYSGEILTGAVVKKVNPVATKTGTK